MAKYNITIRLEYAHGILSGKSYSDGEYDKSFKGLSKAEADAKLHEIGEYYQGTDGYRMAGLKPEPGLYLCHRTNSHFEVQPHIYTWVKVEIA